MEYFCSVGIQFPAVPRGNVSALRALWTYNPLPELHSDYWGLLLLKQNCRRATLKNSFILVIIKKAWSFTLAKTYAFITCIGNGTISFLIIKLTRCTNYSNLFLEWNFTCYGQFLSPSSGVFHCTHSNGICRTNLLTTCEQNQDGTEFHSGPARKLSAKLYDTKHCCVYSEKLLMMDRGTDRNK
jgi:hypothetical protein